VIAQNRGTIFKLVSEALGAKNKARLPREGTSQASDSEFTV
jgi:hypothetical protein